MKLKFSKNLSIFFIKSILMASFSQMGMLSHAQAQSGSGANSVNSEASQINKTPTPSTGVQTPENVDLSSKPTYFLCRNKSLARTIRISYEGKKCIATYTKNGTDEIVAKSGTHSKCFDVLDKIKINLEKAEWKCKDISESRVSQSLE